MFDEMLPSLKVMKINKMIAAAEQPPFKT